MRVVWTLATLVLLAGCLRFVQAPPARYDYPFPGEVVVRQLSAADADRTCQFNVILPERPWAGVACSWRDGSRCHVIISVRATDYAAALRHEVAHCNGWPADHPDD